MSRKTDSVAVLDFVPVSYPPRERTAADQGHEGKQFIFRALLRALRPFVTFVIHSAGEPKSPAP
jgi:hypothetical protein